MTPATAAPRTPSGRRLPALVLAVACAVLAGGVLSACSVGGDAQPSNPDLSSRSVSASDFPTPASPIPPQAVANALADITGSPSPGQGSNTEISPSECAPPPVSADGAVAFLGPGTAERSTLTTVVAHVDTPLADVVRRAEKCPELTTTTFGASSTVTTEVLPAPPARDGVETATIRRTILTGGGTVPTTTSSLSLIGERDGVRVYAEYRWPAAGPVPAEDSAALDELFTKAVSAAFG